MMWRYRFVPEQWGWELPGGIVDEGEDARQTALREVVGRDRLAPGVSGARRHLSAHGRHGRLTARDLRRPGRRAGR